MIIGFTGFKQVGKSTASKYLADKHGFERVNFKDGMLAKMLEDFPDFIPAFCKLLEKHYWNGKPWTFERLNNEKPEAWRAFMINYGTDLWRVIEDNIWVRKWGERIEGKTNVIADDVRFLNEAQKLKEKGGIIVRLKRPDVVTGGSHASESQQIDIVPDYTIVCEQGDFTSLYKQLDFIYETNRRD